MELFNYIDSRIKKIAVEFALPDKSNGFLMVGGLGLKLTLFLFAVSFIINLIEDFTDISISVPFIAGLFVIVGFVMMLFGFVGYVVYKLDSK